MYYIYNTKLIKITKYENINNKNFNHYIAKSACI
jgi:hypothetical protein